MNILRYKRFTYQELAGNDGGWNSGGSSSNAYTPPEGYTVQASDNPDEGGTLVPTMTGFEGNSGKAADDNISNQAAYTPDTSTSSQPSIWDRLGIQLGTTANDYFNNETQAHKDDRMGLVNNALGTVGNAAMYSNPISSMGMTLGGIYNNYDSNKSVTENLASIFSPGQLTTLAAKALGAPTQVASYAGLGANVATSKDPLATAASFLNGQLGNKIGSYTGINMSPFTSRVATAGLNTIFNTARKSL